MRATTRRAADRSRFAVDTSDTQVAKPAAALALLILDTAFLNACWRRAALEARCFQLAKHLAASCLRHLRTIRAAALFWLLLMLARAPARASSCFSCKSSHVILSSASCSACVSCICRISCSLATHSAATSACNASTFDSNSRWCSSSSSRCSRRSVSSERDASSLYDIKSRVFAASARACSSR